MPLSQAEIDYQTAHRNESRAPDIVNVHVAFIVFAVVGVTLRFISRRLKAGLGIDDWVMLAALIVTLGEGSGVLYCALNFKSARHMLFVANPVGIAKMTMAVQCLYSTGISTAKISVLLMYNRIFGRASRRFRYALIATGCFIIAYNLIQFIVVIFQCQPINAAWNPNVKDAKCVKLMLELEIAGGFNALTDLITVLLPLPILWRTQMPTKKKVQVFATFLVGGFVTIVSFWRIPMQRDISLVDASWTDVTACNWSFVEVVTAIICGSLPAMRPLFTWCANGGRLESTAARSGASASGPSAKASSPSAKVSNASSSAGSSTGGNKAWDDKDEVEVRVSEVSEDRA